MIDLRSGERGKDQCLKNDNRDQDLDANQLVKRTERFELAFHANVECGNAPNRYTSKNGGDDSLDEDIESGFV